jgi:hypothetical protein
MGTGKVVVIQFLAASSLWFYCWYTRLAYSQEALFDHFLILYILFCIRQGISTMRVGKSLVILAH